MSPLRMSRLNSLLLLSFVGLGLGHELPEESVAIDNATLLVFFGTRHGNRNPEQFIPDTPRNWGQEGEIELTSFGKRQGYGLGEELRKFADSLILKNFQPSEAKFFSSSANRCQMTLQAALAGLYPPQSYAVFDSALDWTPVPYTIDDPMLRMYAVSPCPNSDAAWRPISQDTLPALANLTQESRPLLEYMAEKTGWKPTISNAADLADSLLNIALFNASLPAWIAHPSLEGYSAASLRAAFLAFAENHQIACAEYAPCRDMMAGVWVQHVADVLEQLKAGKTKLKLIGYASHTEVTLSTMKALHIARHEITTSAGFLVEVRRLAANLQVRLLVHDPNPIDKHVIYQADYQDDLQALAKDNWVDLDEFLNLIKPKAISDWQQSCGIQPNCN